MGYLNLRARLFSHYQMIQSWGRQGQVMLRAKVRHQETHKTWNEMDKDLFGLAIPWHGLFHSYPFKEVDPLQATQHQLLAPR